MEIYIYIYIYIYYHFFLLSKINEYLSMSLVTHKEGDFFLLHLFVVVSSLFSLSKLTMACYKLFHFLQATTLQKVLTYKFTNKFTNKTGQLF